VKAETAGPGFRVKSGWAAVLVRGSRYHKPAMNLREENEDLRGD
jgi:hypothetical protein